MKLVKYTMSCVMKLASASSQINSNHHCFTSRQILNTGVPDVKL